VFLGDRGHNEALGSNKHARAPAGSGRRLERNAPDLAYPIVDWQLDDARPTLPP
jgi:hypothetical protein